MQTAWFDVTMPYLDIYEAQQQWVTQRRLNLLQDALWMGEHPHTITCGRKTQDENLLHVEDMAVVPIERGGDVTYHGPGQLVIYPILRLEPRERDVHRHLRLLEQLVIDMIADYGLQGHRKEGFSGVWVIDSDQQERKIASVGVAVKQWVTYHGIALNVSTDLTVFQRLNPCGLPAQVMTSMTELLPTSPTCRELAEQSVPHAVRLWQRDILPSPLWPSLSDVMATVNPVGNH